MLNRAANLAQVARALRDRSGEGGLLGVLVVRSQRVREVELTHGYAAAERLGEAMQAALAAALRGQDQVLRIGEQDFLALLPGLRSRQHAALAAAKVVRALREPVPLDGWPVQPSVAVGVALAPEDGADAETLCLRADQACDDARASADGYAFWDREAHAAGLTRDDLRDALVGNRLDLVLQPLLDLKQDRICGYEALSRWNHPRLGQVPPPEFIGMAERAGLIGEVTRWSLNVALRHLARVRASGSEAYVSVNVSVVALLEPGFVLHVLDVLRLWRVPPQGLVLEVTETALMRDMQRGEAVLAELHDAGIRIAIDDFGTGYSSMAYLQRLPVSELKIDRSFVTGITTNRRAWHLVGSMVDLGHHLGLEVVAEGVEDEATLEMLRELACDRAQGYVIARPMPAASISGA